MFFGLVSEFELKKIYETAYIFINPRPSYLSGSSMNFPSKVLEYLSYGKPVISTWTSGLSPNYAEILEILEEETEDCLARTITNVLRWSKKRRAKNHDKIAQFLKDHKTWDLQAKRLIRWLREEIL